MTPSPLASARVKRNWWAAELVPGDLAVAVLVDRAEPCAERAERFAERREHLLVFLAIDPAVLVAVGVLHELVERGLARFGDLAPIDDPIAIGVELLEELDIIDAARVLGLSGYRRTPPAAPGRGRPREVSASEAILS